MGSATSKPDVVKTPQGEVPHLADLVLQMQQSLSADDKSYRLRTYRQVLVGSDIVDWMQQQAWYVDLKQLQLCRLQVKLVQVRVQGSGSDCWAVVGGSGRFTPRNI